LISTPRRTPLLLGEVLSQPLTAWTGHTITDPDAVRQHVETVRRQGWATAVDAVQIGVNALAVPVFDYRGDWRGAIALVGATQFIPGTPSDEQIAHVKRAAQAASRRLGWER
jgi:DNA-binding IclR family transcriptional regulator